MKVPQLNKGLQVSSLRISENQFHHQPPKDHNHCGCFYFSSFLFSLSISFSFSLFLSPFHLCLHVSQLSSLLSLSAVESLYTALKNIDRLDIINMLEGQQGAPAPPTRQGSRELNRRRHHDREHLSPGLTNGEFKFKNPHLSLPPPSNALPCQPDIVFSLNFRIPLCTHGPIISMKQSVSCLQVF